MDIKKMMVVEHVEMQKAADVKEKLGIYESMQEIVKRRQEV